MASSWQGTLCGQLPNMGHRHWSALLPCRTKRPVKKSRRFMNLATMTNYRNDLALVSSLALLVSNSIRIHTYTHTHQQRLTWCMFVYRSSCQNGSWLLKNEWFDSIASISGKKMKKHGSYNEWDHWVVSSFQGLAKYVLNNVQDAKSRGVVVGHDHRHHSEDFARLTAAAFISLGIRVWYYHDYVHTPMVVCIGYKTLLDISIDHACHLM